MTQIYALQGTGHRKKYVIWDLYRILKTLYPKSNNKEYPSRESFTEIIQCENGLKIGIANTDECASFENNLKQLREKGCDVIFCSCSLERGSVEIVQKMEDESCIVHLIGLKPLKNLNTEFIFDENNHDPQAHELRILAGV